MSRYEQWSGSVPLLWEDLRFPAQGINPAGTAAPPAIDTADPFAGTLLFSASATNVIAGVAQLPHSWKIGTTLHPHIHWCPTTTGSGNVAWRFSWHAASINGTFSGSYTTAGIEVDAASQVVGRHQMFEFSDMDMSAVTGVSAMIAWKLERVGGDDLDTYAGQARLLELDFHFQMDTAGSRQEASK